MQNFQTSMQNGLVIGEAIGRGLAARRQKKRNNALATSFQEGGLEALGNTAAEQGNLQLAMQARQAWDQSRQAASQNVRDAMEDFEGYAARIVQNADDPETAQAAMIAMGMQVAQRHNIPTEEFMQSAPVYTNYDIAKVVFSDADAEVARDNIRSQINDREQDNRRADEQLDFAREQAPLDRAIDQQRADAGTLNAETGAARLQFDAQRAVSDGITEGAARDREQQARQLQAQRSLQGRFDRVQLVSDTIDRAMEQSRGSNTGPIAGRNPLATNLEATLSTIEANLGFDELQRMRDNSPTGGALGQVTEREIAFLQSVLANLSRTQTEQQLDSNLLTAKQQIQLSFQRIAEAYQQDYGAPWDGGAGPSSSPATSGAPQLPPGFELDGQ